MKTLLSLCDSEGNLPHLERGTRIGLANGLRCFVRSEGWQDFGNGEWRLSIGSIDESTDDEWWRSYILNTEKSLKRWYVCPIVPYTE